MMDEGVSSMRSRGVVTATPMTVVTAEAMAARVMQLPMDSDSFFLSPAPKFWEITMPAPVDMPTNRASSRFRMGAALPTAARALSPT